MGLDYYGQGGAAPSILDRNTIGENTTADDKQIFLMIGDSNMVSSSAQSAVAVSAGIMFKWDGSAFVETTNGVNNSTAGHATMMEEFIIAYNAATGKKGCFVNRGLSTTAFGPTSGLDFTLAWAGQARYTSAVTEANEALVSLSLTKLKAIFINLGINDQITSEATYWNELLDDIEADFPDTPIIAVSTGTNSGYTQGFYTKRKMWIDQARNRENVFLMVSAPSVPCIADGLHYNVTGLGNIGSMFARLYANSAITNKWSRCLISSHFDDLSANRKTLLADFIESQINNGNYFRLEAFYLYQTTIQANALIDLALLGGTNTLSNITFTANSDIETNATNSEIQLLFKTPTYNSRASQNDIIIGERHSSIITLAASAARVFGAEDATALFKFRKVSGNILYSVNDLTDTNVAEPIEENQWYHIARDGGNKYLIKNKTIIHTAAVASTGTPATLNGSRLGAVTGAAGTAVGRIAAKFKCYYAAKYVGFDLTSWVDELEYLLAHWND